MHVSLFCVDAAHVVHVLDCQIVGHHVQLLVCADNHLVWIWQVQDSAAASHL
jgi:hypothetical protein